MLEINSIYWEKNIRFNCSTENVYLEKIQQIFSTVPVDNSDTVFGDKRFM